MKDTLPRVFVVVGALFFAGACGAPEELDDVPPGWETAQPVKISHAHCKVSLDNEKLSATWAKTDDGVELLLLRLSMSCTERLAAALRNPSSNRHQVLIYSTRPLAQGEETCGCKFDATVYFGLGGGDHHVEVLTWSRWGTDPSVRASVDLSI